MGTLLTPIAGVVSGGLQLGEIPELLEGIGITLILIGLAALSWERLPQ